MKSYPDFSWTDWLLIICLFLLAPFFLFPKLSLLWVLSLVPLIWIVRGIEKKSFLPRMFLNWFVFFLTVQVLATCFIVPDLSFSLPKITGVFFGMMVFYALVSLLRTETSIKYGVLLFLFGGAAFSSVGILGISKHTEPKYIGVLYEWMKALPVVDFNLPGAEQGFHPNAVGAGIILVLPLCFVLLLPYLRGKKNEFLLLGKLIWILPLSLCLLVMTGVLLLTQSRSSFLGMFIGVWLLIITALSRKRLIAVFVTLVMLAAIVGIFSLVGSDKIPYTNGESKNKLAGRITVFWTPAVKTIKQYPVFGIGMNNARTIPKVGYYQAHFHNQFLHTAAELGLPGLAAYLAILIGAAYMCFRVWRHASQGWVRLAALGLGCGQLALIAFGILDTLPLGAKVGLFFWISLGLIAALYNMVHSESSNTKD